MTKTRFLAVYRDELNRRYPWAQDEARLNRFMASVSETINGTGPGTWIHEGGAVTAAWRNIGGKGRPTKKALRELPA